MLDGLEGSSCAETRGALCMGVPAYTIVVVCMGALSAAAAIGALSLALGQLKPRGRTAHKRAAPARPMVFDAPPRVEPPRAPELPPELALPQLEPEPKREPAPQPEHELELEPEILPEPVAPPALREPVRRLALALMSRRAPERLCVPVGLARGRILELNLPLLLDNAGEVDLEDVSILITLPNEITYGASLERMGREGMAALPGAVARYALSEHETRIRIDIPRLKAGAAVRLPTPISIKHAAHAAYPIVAVAFATGLEPVERRYALELMDPSDQVAPTVMPGAWVCRPDETVRLRDPHLPLDRICSMEFQVSEPEVAVTVPVREAVLEAVD